jgi:hypothetical protein
MCTMAMMAPGIRLRRRYRGLHLKTSQDFRQQSYNEGPELRWIKYEVSCLFVSILCLVSS